MRQWCNECSARSLTLDTEAPARDFGFRAKVGYREDIRRLIEATR